MKHAVARLIQSEYLVLVLCVVYFAALAPITPGLATPENMLNVLAAMLPLLVVATGQTLVLITAGIDLSVTSIIALASVAGAAIMTGDEGWLAGNAAATPTGILAMLLVGMAVGLINGLCVSRLAMPPFIVTLTTMMFFSGLAIWWTQSKSIYNLPDSFLVLGKNVWLSGLIAAAVAVAAQVMLSRTLLGSGLRAVGSNLQTARVSGVRVAWVITAAYVLSGLCAGVAAVLITSRLETGSPVHWRNNLLDVIGATVIGGTSLYGGKGKVLWTFFGVLLLALIDNSLELLALSYFTIMMVKGGVILLAALLDALRNRTARA
jgi:ribose/xylose/arabinose/galactoside ABC-type transport system permease subunit